MYINNRHKVTKDTKCSVLNVLTVNQDQQGNVFFTYTLHLHTHFTYTQVYKFNGGS